MIQATDELELFHCFRGQLDEGFLLFKQGNLAVTLQQMS